MICIQRSGLAGAVLALICLGGQAHAQTAESTLRVQKPFRIKLGAFFPSDGDLRDFAGSTFFSYGVSYDLAKSRAAKPTIYSLFLDGVTKSHSENVSISGDTYDAESRVTYTGIGPSLRAYLTPATRGTRGFVGIGIGAYFVRRSVELSIENLEVTVARSNTRFGGKVFGGVEIGSGIFAEADYTLLGELEGISLNGFNVSLGYRF